MIALQKHLDLHAVLWREVNIPNLTAGMLSCESGAGHSTCDATHQVQGLENTACMSAAALSHITGTGMNAQRLSHSYFLVAVLGCTLASVSVT